MPTVPSLKVRKKDSWTWILVVLFPFAAVTIIGIYYSSLPQKVPLYYSLPWGNNQLAEKQFLFLLPVLMLVVSIANGVIKTRLQKQDDGYLRQVILVTNIVFDLVVLVSVIQIIRIII